MKKKKKFTQKDSLDFFNKLVNLEKGERAEWRERCNGIYQEALNNVHRTIGEKEIGTYTRKDVIDFIKKKYKATEISFPECYEYASRHPERIAAMEAPLLQLTDGWYLPNKPVGVEAFMLPPLTDKPFDVQALKNGLILVCVFENNQLDTFDWFGNTEFYSLLWNSLQILTGKKEFGSSFLITNKR